MAVDKDEVRRIAKLAALDLTEAEIERYQVDLEAILAYVSQIQEAAAEANPEEPEAEQRNNALRDDVVRPGLTREQALQNAPDTDGLYFRVPPAIPGGGH